MNNSKRRITVKVLISYIALALLVVVVGKIVYNEINSFTRAQEDDTLEKNKIIRIGKLLNLLYESESFARSAIQSNREEPFENYLNKNESIIVEIDSLQKMVINDHQQKLLDSVKLLIRQKVNNIRDLRQIRHSDNAEKALEKAIAKFSNIEETLGRLSLTDFVASPSTIPLERRQQLQEWINILNRNIPRDSTNTVDEKTLDSLVIASRAMLEDIREEVSQQKLTLTIKENQLLQNDLTTSQQLREILSAFENEFLNISREENLKREKVLRRSLNVITVSAIIAAILVIIFSILILNDFWKTQKYREQIEASNEFTKSLLKSREQLISMVSHDMRTPLSTILGYTELLKEGNLSNRERYYTDRIRNSSSFMTKLVDDLLDFTKLEAGKIPVEHIPFDLERLIRDTADGISSLYSDKPIRLKIHIDKAFTKPLLGDPFRIKQILSNLLGNAYKFTEEGSILIAAQISDYSPDIMTITVTDTGIGIRPEKQQAIFEEFTQAEETIEKQYGGTGLGLTISKKLAGLLGGDLSLESEAGKGSSFTLALPLAYSDKPIKTEEKEANGVLHNLSAIIIDDDQTLLQMITEVLRSKGFTIHSYDDAATALSEIPNIHYDLIITDIQLPGMNGFHFAENLRADPKFNYKDQPIIAVTGRKDLNKSSYLDSGFAGFLFKPYSPENLLKTIDQALGNEEMLQEIPETNQATKDSAPDFDLSPLRSFLSDDDSMIELLELFIANSKQDLIRIKDFADASDYNGVKNLAHKMQTMFRQIKAGKVTGILDELEYVEINDAKILTEKTRKLEHAIEQTFDGIMLTIKSKA
ncbi:ATP-binding protein [Robertkochia solimangrovi]|uniref:ATP-binding protein n=1 Tax=Robertkochia solimangrovi TaxID=2213046 RepID=UPI0011806160|nr:ATP-binding protein [Robertkochia solimangrovi]TRZ46403.1 hybrid sensor histidine kinase/response regulator [Robertkochia solimangrovi]